MKTLAVFGVMALIAMSLALSEKGAAGMAIGMLVVVCLGEGAVIGWLLMRKPDLPKVRKVRQVDEQPRRAVSTDELIKLALVKALVGRKEED